MRELGVTLAATSLPLGPLRDFLDSDGLHLPAHTSECGPLLKTDPRSRSRYEGAGDSDNESWASGPSRSVREDAPEAVQRLLGTDALAAGDAEHEESDDSSSVSVADAAVSVPDIEHGVHAALSRFGALFVKLEWTAPVDAAWVHSDGLRVTSPGHMFLLLKASDLVRYDLDHAQPSGADGADVHIVLRPWYVFHRSHEFRCFVRNKQCIAIGQRHATESYEHLPALKDALRAGIAAFVDGTVAPAFPLRSFVVDVYQDTKGRWWVLDFAPFGGDTDAGLFSWDELLPDGQPGVCPGCSDSAVSVLAPDLPELRIVEPGTVRTAPHAVHAFPDDLLHAAAARAGL